MAFVFPVHTFVADLLSRPPPTQTPTSTPPGDTMLDDMLSARRRDVMSHYRGSLPGGVPGVGPQAPSGGSESVRGDSTGLLPPHAGTGWEPRPEESQEGEARGMMVRSGTDGTAGTLTPEDRPQTPQSPTTPR